MKYNIKILSVFVIFSICLCIVGAVVKITATNKQYNCLIDKVIYVDAGHGGKDNGASVDDVMEDNINMKISGYLIELLINDGAYVLTSRTSDYDLSSLYQKNRKREDLNKRVKYINNSKPNIFISIHLNAFSLSSVNGAQVFHQDNESSKNLASFIQNKLNILTNKSRSIKKGDYFILNRSNSVGVLVECGFLSNSEERKKLNDSEYQRKIASKIEDGIVEFFYNI